MDAKYWDARYEETDLRWSREPNQWIAETTEGLPPGRILDLAAGEGRNAVWLAERGWEATALDFSSVALERTVRIAGERLGADASRFTVMQADLAVFAPEPRSYDLVIVVYLQVKAGLRARALRGAAAAVAAGGTLVVVAHDSQNAVRGFGAPPDPAVLYTAGDVTDDLRETGMSVQRAELVSRWVETPDGRREAR